MSLTIFKLPGRRSQLANAALGGALLGLVLSYPSSVQAEPPQKGSTLNAQSQQSGELWVGWLETKSQNLRLIINLSSSAAGTPTGTIISPDQFSEPIPIANAAVDAQGQLSFQVTPDAGKAASYSFSGKIDGAALSGQIEQAGTVIPIRFIKTELLKPESKVLLGADSAWIGSLDVGSRKVPLRFRFYSSEPYATPDQPRILFDSLAENANGFRASVSLNDKGLFEFSVPAIPGNAKYIAELTEDKQLLTGKFQQGFLPLQLDMKRVDLLESQDAAHDPMVDYLSGLAKQSDQPESQPKPAPKKPTVEPPKPQMDEEGHSTPRVSLANGLQEEDFVVERFDSRKPLLNESGKRADNTFQLAGSITYPKGFDPKAQYPAVVLVTGSGPQDRDETIGRHKPFREIANYLASQGLVVMRYDDRGVGKSTGDFAKATTRDFADDALAVWQFAREIEGIDRTRIGILGHSEGGMIGPMVAALQREVAFLMLIAPPILPGTEILSSQIDRLAELEGVSPEDREVANGLQKELQRIALRFPADDETALSEVRKAVVKRWDTLSLLSQSVPGEDEDTRKKAVIDAITAQFRGLQSPWMRYFLAYDPASNWVLFDCPVLAVWAEKDTQVLYEPNRAKLEQIVSHNMNIRADMVVLPGLNHLLQRAKTGLPQEYDEIDQAIDPLALETFGNWLKEREILP